MIHRLVAPILCLMLFSGLPATAQEEGIEAAPEEMDLAVDPAFSDDPNAVVVAEPSAAERQAAVAAARGPETARATGATLRGLDKVTGQLRDFTMAAGEVAEFGRIKVTLAECRYPANDPDSDAFAELTVFDKRANDTVFSGWMIASSPALSAMDDPRYDVWVMSCSKS